MPFTPFHFGPGSLIKATMPKQFSFTVFVFSQVLIDVESLYFLVHGEWPVHRFFHTYTGATLIALASYWGGRPICGIALAVLGGKFVLSKSGLAQAIRLISRTAAASGAVIGAYSHVALDSIMHGDMRPFAPFSDANGLFDFLSPGELHVYCLVAGLVGGVGMGFWWLVWKTEEEDR
ncbi:MAG: DUF4184 domain-containing protein [Chromatiales bacterium]|nr:DUF4184 domain-containing protein [Chromatiales bacterium]